MRQKQVNSVIHHNLIGPYEIFPHLCIVHYIGAKEKNLVANFVTDLG